MAIKHWLAGEEDGRTPIRSEKDLRRLIRDKVHEQIQAAQILDKLKTDAGGVKGDLTNLVDRIVRQEGYLLPDSMRRGIQEYILDEVTGLGVLEPLIRDSNINEIMVNGPNHVWVVERDPHTGYDRMVERKDIQFDDDNHVLHVIQRIVGPRGRRVDESTPRVDTRLADGSRVNIVIPPLALDGPTITIRKFPKVFMRMGDLINKETISTEAADFLRVCVERRLNIVVSGGTGSGKTTLLNVLSAFIPDNERIVTIEDTAELQLFRYKPHVVRMESRPPNVEGKGQVTIRDLVVNALRMRPDRIVVGEVRSSETVDMLQAMNTGHDGSLTTLHSNSPREAVSRMVNMFLMGDIQLQDRVILQQIAQAVQLVVQIQRLEDGSRKITEISQLREGIDSDDICQIESLFVRTEKGLTYTGNAFWHTKKLNVQGHTLPPLRVFGGR